MAWYVDTSAFLKLVVVEERSGLMRAWANHEEARAGALWSSDLLRTEAVRAARRVSHEALETARDHLDRMGLVTLTSATYGYAGEIEPAVPRSLDALHLAAALSLGDDLDGIVTYDDTMAVAARALGLATSAP